MGVNYPKIDYSSKSMKRHVLMYGLIGGILITVLQWTQYRFLVIEHSIEIYVGLTAAIFAGLGLWLGLRLTKPRPKIETKEAPIFVGEPLAPNSQTFVLNEQQQEDLGITPRELEVLGLIAQGMSNSEIAGKLFVSENTVKTHCSRVFDKLGAKRRTQAVQLGKEFGLLP